MSKTMATIQIIESELFPQLVQQTLSTVMSDYELAMHYPTNDDDRVYVGKFGKYRGVQFIKDRQWLSYPIAAMLYHLTFLPYALKRGYL